MSAIVLLFSAALLALGTTHNGTSVSIEYNLINPLRVNFSTERDNILRLIPAMVAVTVARRNNI